MRRHDRQYHRYGFHCHTGRLTVVRRQPAPPALPLGVSAAVRVAGQAWALTAGAGAVWVQEGDTGVARIDTATNAITARIAGIDNLAFAGDELWGAAGDRLVRLDPRSGQILATISLPTVGAHRVVADGAALWVPLDDGVFRIDRAAATAEKIPLRCPGSREAAIGHGSLWLACKDTGTVMRVDPVSRQVVAAIATGRGAHHVAIGDGAVWVTNYEENTVSRIDPASNAPVAKISGAGSGIGLTVAAGLVWAATSNGIATIDPETNTVRGRIELGAAQYYYGLVFADGSLWASATALGRVYRIRPPASG
jgi:DNA-binding beta-propeller fold protein YncE